MGYAPRPMSYAHPRHCILPPHMIEAIRLRGDAGLRKMADGIEQDGQRFRAARCELMPPAATRRAQPVAARARIKPERKVYDAQQRRRLPGKLVRAEGDARSSDADVDRAYDGAGATFKLFLNVYQRHSLDGEGMPLVSSVHYGKSYNNAFWDGEQMVYGDGDGILFRSFTRSLSVIAHELSHGVVQFSGGLVYRDQSGALSESFADVFGVLTLQYRRKQAAHEADWLVGKGLLGPDVRGAALRSLKAPGTAYDDAVLGKDPKPFHMDDFVYTSSDNGGVHINSGIPNHAFYLLAQNLCGNAWERAGHIWYDTLQSIDNPHASFADWADRTVELARERFGAGSTEAIQTRRSWKLVGIAV